MFALNACIEQVDSQMVNVSIRAVHKPGGVCTPVQRDKSGGGNKPHSDSMVIVDS